MRHSLGDVQQISGNEDPIRTQIANGVDDPVVPRLVPVDMKVTEVNGPAAGKRSVDLI
jgi:hypothetical protein